MWRGDAVFHLHRLKLKSGSPSRHDCALGSQRPPSRGPRSARRSRRFLRPHRVRVRADQETPRGAAARHQSLTPRAHRPDNFRRLRRIRARAPPIKMTAGPSADQARCAPRGLAVDLDRQRRAPPQAAKLKGVAPRPGPAHRVAPRAASREANSAIGSARAPGGAPRRRARERPLDKAGVDAAGTELRRRNDGGKECEIGLRPGDAHALSAAPSRPTASSRSAPSAITLASIAS